MTSRTPALIFLALLLAQLLAPAATAHHAARDDAPAVPVPPLILPLPPWAPQPPREVPVPDANRTVSEDTDTIPAVDAVRDHVLDAQRQAIDTLNRELARRNLSPDGFRPAVPAQVLLDPFEEGARVGGVGAWTVLGGAWRADADAGRNASAARVVSDPATGRYGPMDAWLVSPAIDLSAYAAQTGVVPFASLSPTDQARQSSSVLENYFRTFMDPGADSRPVRDQVNLLLRHRFNLKNGVDGAQVLLFQGQPPASTAEKGVVLEPMASVGSGARYASVQSLGGRGFTNASDWDVSAFDLTPWAGKTVWVAFRVAAASRASEPGHFSSGFSKDLPYGWTLDEVEVLAPAWGKNLKVYAIDGPAFRTDARDPVDRVAPGSNVTVGAVVLNAAGTSGEAVVEMDVRGLDQPLIVRQSRHLRPGEVWVANVTFQAPAENGTATVSARAWNPGPDRTRLADPTPGDNQRERAYLASPLPRLDLRAGVERMMVDDGEAQLAWALVANTGNVPLPVRVSLSDFRVAVNATTGNRTEPETFLHDPQDVVLAPGERRNLTWSVDATRRGEHLLNLTALAPGAAAEARARYYVHASPPPVLALEGGAPADAAGWTRALAHAPIPPEDDWVWMSAGTNSLAVPPVLRATPAAAAEQPGTRWQDLRLSVRYMGFLTASKAESGFARVSVAYAVPASLDSDVGVTGPDVFRLDLPLPSGSGIEHATNLSWQTLDARVVPSEARGYVDAWGLQGLEVRVRGPAITSLGAMAGAFYLDDLRLTGVPVGGDESQRTDLVRITGDDPAAGQVDAVQTVAPMQPSSCQVQGVHCWTRVDAAQLRQAVDKSAWRAGVPGEAFDGSAVAWRYAGAVPGRPDRLVTPALRLEGAADPLLILDHAYAFPSYPQDDAGYTVDQLGFVEMQYRRDDGTWSEFVRLVPDGGYPTTLSEGREKNTLSRYKAGDGFYHPPRCEGVTSLVCDNGGFYRNRGADGSYRWTDFAPTPRREVSVFHLKQAALAGVDLTEREVRLGFHASLITKTDLPAVGSWALLGARVTPVERFAVDGALEAVALDAPFDWRALGVGPGSTVPVNVTVRNAGVFRDAFSVRLGVAVAGEEPVFAEPVPAGELAPGEARALLLPWDVPAGLDGSAVVLAVEVLPTDNRTADDNPYNDRAALGRDEPLHVRAVPDVAVLSGAFPQKADASVPRLVPVTLRNLGNVPLEGLEVERRIERLDPGRLQLVDRRAWTLSEPLPADPRGVNLLRLAPDARDADLSFTPPTQGTYLLTVTVRAPGVRDADASNDAFRQYFEAAQPLLAEDFEGRLRWEPSDPRLWGEAPGFRSDTALAARDPATGLLPAGTDAWMTTPVLPLADVQAATVSLLAKYDLEKGYDAAVLEVSTDNRTWHAVPPIDALGRAAPYPVPLVGSNPLAAAAPPGATVSGLSGSSWDEPVQFDGWTPLAFDLAHAPGLSETVSFRTLDAPRPGAAPVVPLDPTKPAVGFASWMVTDPSDAAGRWEIRNGTVREDVPRWWSDLGTGDGKVRRLSRAFPDLSTVPQESALVLSWWDRRPGQDASAWTGVGADYRVLVRVGEAAPIPLDAQVASLAYEKGWHRLSVALPGGLDRSKPLEVRFDFLSTDVSSSNLGWEVRDVRLEAYPTAGSRVVPGSRPLLSLTGPEESELALWEGWRRVLDVKPRPAPWGVVVEPGPDGRDAPQWKLTLDAANRTSVDARLVSPVVDLSAVGGGRATLRLTHQYDLLWREDPLTGGKRLDQGKHYQAGVVEVEVFNRSTGAWDAPRQLFADAAGPTRAPVLRPADGSAGADAAPYPRSLLPAGDTFERYARAVSQRFTVLSGSAQYLRLYDDPAPTVSFAFSGHSQGWVTDEFDLGAYRGERVRLVLHAWSGPSDPEQRAHSWTVARMEVLGKVLDAKDVRLRVRVATDQSLLDGAFAIDRLEITGVPHARSVGVHLDAAPAQVDLGGAVTLRGTLRNHGPGTREQVALGVRVAGPAASAPIVLAANGTPTLALPASSGHALAVGPFTLKPAGRDGDAQPFELRILGGPLPDAHVLTLEVLDGTASGGGIAYARAVDDVPGRAARTWTLETRRLASAALDVVEATPASLAAPGEVAVVAKGRNEGTTNLTLTARLSVLQPDGLVLGTRASAPRTVRPGEAFTAEIPPIPLAAKGDHLLKVDVLDAGQPVAAPLVRPYRVGTADTLLASGFDGALDGWAAEGSVRFQPSLADARFGAGSLLFGVEDAAHEEGLRVERTSPDGNASGTLTSPVVDLRAAGDGPVLAFWHKPLLHHGRVSVQAQALAPGSLEPHPDCPAWLPLPTERLGGRSAAWRLATVDLAAVEACGTGPLAQHRVRVRFAVEDAHGQGWRLDGVTVASGAARVLPAARAHEVGDGGRKEFPLVIENPGHAPKEVTLALDPRISKLSSAQARWVTVEPASARVPPGGSVEGRVVVDVPAMRGAFPQELAVGLSLVDAAAPYLPAESVLNLSFRPRARADLVLSAAVGGRALGASGLDVEEATPHEVAILVANEGTEASRATEVRLAIRDASGATVWEHREKVGPVGPGVEGGEAAVVAATWKPPFGKRGNHTLHAVADPDALQVDYDRADSVLQLPLVVTELLRPDLAVPARAMRLTTPEGQPVHETVPGALVRVSGVVTNEGPREARQVTVRLVAGAAVLKEELVPVLAPGASHAIHANQRAPAQSTSYRLVAFTPDVETRADNNEHALELPVFPPELRLEGPAEPVRVEPGAALAVPLRLANDGPHPLLVSLAFAGGDARLATLGTRDAALAPGESRNVTLTLEPDASLRAGPRKVVVLAETAEGVRTRRTVEVEVAPRPAAAVVPLLARGPPSDVRVELDVLNTGNVPLAPEAVVRDAAGAVLLRARLDEVPPGVARLSPLSLRLPEGTPPGALPARVALESEGRALAEAPLALDVRPWSRVSARVGADPVEGATRAYTLTFAHEGNAPASRRPVLLGLPEGVSARYDADEVDLAPGATRTLRLEVAADKAAPPGLYLLQAGLLDPADPDALLGNLTTLPLDLRRGVLDLPLARRVGAETPVAGERVAYAVTVRNRGDAPTLPAPVHLYVDGRLVAREDVGPLQPGETREVTLAWPAAAAGVHGVVLAVDPHGAHGHDAAAFAESLDVRSGAPIVEGLSRVPVPGALWALVALAAACALLRRRREPPCAA